MGNLFKVVLILILVFFAFGFIYRVLFKLGVLALVILIGYYIYQQSFAKK
ncbi:MAG: hypothetical protein AAFO69_04510 [Bacteroidota bacterium]